MVAMIDRCQCRNIHSIRGELGVEVSQLDTLVLPVRKGK